MIKKVKMRDGNLLSVAVIRSIKDSDNKPWVVMVHGIGGSHHMWLPYALPFLGDFNFIIPNLRGFGLSGDVPYLGKSAIHNFAWDIADCVDAFVPEDKKVTLIALSMGSYASMQYLKTEGAGKVERFLSIDQAPKAINSKGWRHGLVGKKQQFLLPRFKSLLEECQENDYYDREFDCLPESIKLEYQKCLCEFFESAFHRKLEKQLVSMPIYLGIKPALNIVSANRLASYAHCLRSYVDYDYDFRDMFKKLNIPVTLFVGKHSEMYPAEGQLAISKLAKNCKVVLFDESHGLMYTAPIQFYRELKKFLKP